MSAHLSPEEIEVAAKSSSPNEHLAGCTECRASVTRARGRQALLKGMTPYTLSDAAFARAEAGMLEKMREPAPSMWRWWLPRLLPVAAVVAIAVAVFMRAPPRTETPLVADGSKSTPVVEVAAARVPTYQTLTVALMQGAVMHQVIGAPEPTPLALGTRLAAGTLLIAQGDGARVVGVSDSDQVRVELHGKSRVGEPGVSVMLLGPGSVASLDVKQSSFWLVRAGDHWFGSTDASFTVTEIAADQIVLEVNRGMVHFGDWSQRDAVGTPANRGSRIVFGAGGGSKRNTHELSGAAAPVWREGVSLSLGMPASQLELDGQQYGGAPLDLLLPPGKHSLRATMADGSVKLRDFELVSGRAMQLSFAEPKAMRADVPVDPVALRAWVADQKPKLRPCYEKWLKAEPDARGQATLTISVSASGRVTASHVEPLDVLPAAVAECLFATAKKWQPPVRDTDVEIPLVFGGQ